MSNYQDSSGERIHTVQAERDLEANWEVDLAKKLEDYLLKICSGEIRGTEEDAAHISINFAEAALLLQGSVQVYSRKVEYLYNLVLHALDFLSEKRQQGQPEDASAEQPEKTASKSTNDDEEDQFWGSDDIPVEPRNCLEASTSKVASFYHFTKPPANLVVLEADCLDTGGDGGELESYLLATNDLYRDFILLDPCDAPSVNDFLDEVNAGNGPTYKPPSVRKTGHSSAKRSRRSSLGKKHDAAFNRSPIPDSGLQNNNCDVCPGPSKEDNFGTGDQGFNMDDRYSPPGNLDDDSDLDDEENDPWKPLNPHEPGNLKVKPFKRVSLKRNMGNSTNSSSQISIAALFPLAKLHGPISPQFKEIWEVRQKMLDQLGNSQSQSNPSYEKVRESLVGGEKKSGNSSDNAESNNWDNDDSGDPGFDQSYGEMPEATFMDEDLPHQQNKHFDGGTRFDTNDCFEQGEPSSQASLEDLCRSHLDALLANIAESEKQTELAARVSSWKQKIEHNLEVQDLRPPFDIQVYGDKILDKLSLESETEAIKPFTDIVMGQEKHDVARSFSALLQLVNDGDIDLKKTAANGNSFCYTSVNPFHVKLLKKDGRQARRNFNFSKKRVKSPLMKARNKEGAKKPSRYRSPTPKSPLENGSPPPKSSKFTSKLQNNSGRRCTPEGKRRRKSRLVEPIDLHSPV